MVSGASDVSGADDRTEENNMGKRLAAIGAAAAIGIGGLTVAAVNPLSVAGAQDEPAAEAPGSGGAETKGKADRNGPLERALDGLVADGTLTEDQADKVTDAVASEVAEGRQARKDRRAETLAVVADALGSTQDEVTAALKDGTSIAAQAEAQGVDRQVVDDALTTALTARIDEAVKAGTITEERGAKATEKLAKAVDRILDADASRAGRGSRHKPTGKRGGN